MQSRSSFRLGPLLLAAAALGSSCSGTTSTKGTATPASFLTMGGPPECPTRITCLQGLQKIYGLHFKIFKALDEVGPLSVAALADNVVQVVRLDSSDPAIRQHGWVILQDDKAFQQAGNIIPVIRSATATPAVMTLVDRISSSMTQGDLFALDAAMSLEHKTPQEAARAFLQNKGFGTSNPKDESITVGSASFSENEALANVYIEVLTDAGYKVHAKLDLGSRETYESQLVSGEVDLLPEYVGNYLTFLNPAATDLSLAQSVSMLRILLAPKGVTVLDPASATDSDTIVVTQATATTYHLTKISDLGKPYPS